MALFRESHSSKLGIQFARLVYIASFCDFIFELRRLAVPSRRRPFAVMPHGSDIEYVVKKDERFRNYGSFAFTDAKKVFVIGAEMRQRSRSRSR